MSEEIASNWRKSNLSNSQTLQPSSLSVSAPSYNCNTAIISKRSPKGKLRCLLQKSEKARALFGWKRQANNVISSQLLYQRSFWSDPALIPKMTTNILVITHNGKLVMTRLMLLLVSLPDSVLHYPITPLNFFGPLKNQSFHSEGTINHHQIINQSINIYLSSIIITALGHNNEKREHIFITRKRHTIDTRKNIITPEFSYTIKRY